MNKSRLHAINISFAHFYHDLFAAFLAPLTLYFIDKFDLSYFLVGTLTVYMRIPCIINPIIGEYNNRLGLKKFILWCPLVTAILMSNLGLAPNYIILSIMLLLAGLSSQFFHVPAPVIVKKLGKNKTGKYMGLFMVGGEGARTLGPVVAVAAVTFLTLEKMYYLSFIALIMFAYLAWATKDLTVDFTINKKSKVSNSIKIFFRKKKLLLIILAMLFSKSFTASVIVAYLPIYLKTLGFSKAFASSSLSIIACSSLIGIMLSGMLSDKIGRIKVLMGYAILAPLSFILFLQLAGIWIYPGLIIIGLVTLSATPVTMSLVQDMCEDIPTVANGFYMTYNFLATALIVLLAGKLSDLIGIMKAYHLCAFISFLGIIILILAGKFHHENPKKSF